MKHYTIPFLLISNSSKIFEYRNENDLNSTLNKPKIIEPIQVQKYFIKRKLEQKFEDQGISPNKNEEINQGLNIHIHKIVNFNLNSSFYINARIYNKDKIFMLPNGKNPSVDFPEYKINKEKENNKKLLNKKTINKSKDEIVIESLSKIEGDYYKLKKSMKEDACFSIVFKVILSNSIRSKKNDQESNDFPLYSILNLFVENDVMTFGLHELQFYKNPPFQIPPLSSQILTQIKMTLSISLLK